MNSQSNGFAYPFIFHKEDAGGYYIESVDLEGAYTGVNEDSLPYAVSMAEEVLGMTIVDMLESGETLPKPSDMNELIVEDGFATLISIDLNDYIKDMKLIKKTVNIPMWVNDLGIRMGVNFSKALTDAITDKAMKR